MGSAWKPLLTRLQPNMNFSTSFVVASLLCALVALRRDLRRRRLSLSRSVGWSLATALDVAATSATVGASAGFLVILIPVSVALRAVPLNSPLTFAFAACILTLALLWQEGQKQIQLQRPAGIVFGEWLILWGAFQLLNSFIFAETEPAALRVTGARVFWGLALVAGGLWIVSVVRPFLNRFEGLMIVEQVTNRGEFVQTEYVAPTPECPHPERWQMLDAQSAEVEVLDFLKALVITTKPALIVETGTFIGHSVIKMAEGLKANGFGRAITIEFDPTICAKARENIKASGLSSWIESRNQSSLDAKIDGMIDLLFSDSDTAIREAEIRRFLPQISPGGLVLVHDASSQFKVVREAAFRLEQEGLLSVVLFSTPRGLVVAQKRQDRK
jgi:predicted O-methyltransferase YrrM